MPHTKATIKQDESQLAKRRIGIAHQLLRGIGEYHKEKTLLSERQRNKRKVINRTQHIGDNYQAPQKAKAICSCASHATDA